MRIQCSLEGCTSVYVSGENPSSNGIRYICARHSDDELRAAGVLKTARTDKDVHFQTIAFDEELDGRVTIEGGENARRPNGHWMHKLPERPDLFISSLSTNPIEVPTNSAEGDE